MKKQAAPAHAILAVPKEVTFGVAGTYEDKPTITNHVVMDAWVFNSDADLANQTPEEFVGVTWGVHKGIANKFAENLNELCGPFRIAKDKYWEMVNLKPGDHGFDEANKYANALIDKFDNAPAPPSFVDDAAPVDMPVF
ncbi:hypothetical protein [Schaalia sp. ZJ1691]|uniref:hypothetical protein n=1 Tax=Schaalia sp. ZJ1691 TaxID=2709404 RepID=UPI0013EC40E6|nr:hypothetical protein [Schaalia sp. ZJ1691]